MLVPSAKVDAAQSRIAQRILDTLDRVDDRLSEHYARQRKQQRTGFRSVVALLVPSDKPGEPPLRVDAIARNLSPSGLSFIHEGRLETKRIIVGLMADLNTVWFQADVVRAREVEAGFWEFGIAFRQRMVM